MRRRTLRRWIAWAITNLAAGALIGVGIEAVVRLDRLEKRDEQKGENQTEDLYRWADDFRRAYNADEDRRRKEAPTPAKSERPAKRRDPT